MLSSNAHIADDDVASRLMRLKLERGKHWDDVAMTKAKGTEWGKIGSILREEEKAIDLVVSLLTTGGAWDEEEI